VLRATDPVQCKAAMTVEHHCEHSPTTTTKYYYYYNYNNYYSYYNTDSN